MKVRQLCADSLGEIGIVSNVDAMDPGDLDLAMRYLRAMVDRLQGDGYLLYTWTRWPFVLTSGVQTYTLGDGGAFDTGQMRPFWLPSAGIIPAGDTVEIAIDVWSRDRWLKEPLKDLTDLWPHAVYYNPDTPTLGTCTFWPAPTSAPTVALAIPAPLTTAADLDPELDLAFAPGGYEEAWRLNLSKRLQRPFRKQQDPELAQDAADALAAIRRLNDPGPPPTPSDPALTGRGGYDIRSNQYRS